MTGTAFQTYPWTHAVGVGQPPEVGVQGLVKDRRNGAGQRLEQRCGGPVPLSGRAAPLFTDGLDRGAVRLSREIR
jgi:hypothetical protein